VFEGAHGFFHGFTNADVQPDFSHLTRELGSSWLMQGVAFKPYPCGTMAQPFIDCALTLRAHGVALDQIASIRCDVGEGTVHRLWEPLAQKHRPANAYAAKFSVPFAIAVALVDGAAGLSQFTDARTRDERVLAMARRISYRVDPHDEYPANYTGHLRAELAGGAVLEFRQAHLRGGRREPLTDVELNAKFDANVRFGGWSDARAEMARRLVEALAGSSERVSLLPLRN
jgi:2-methylcitrate dehydratase PrpD